MKKIEDQAIVLKTYKQLVEEREEKLERMKPDVLPKTLNKRKIRSTFILSNVFDPDDYEYYVTRYQKRSIERKIDKIPNEHLGCEIIKQLFYDQNSINLYYRMKERLSDKLMFYRNYFDINDCYYTESDLLDDYMKPLNLKLCKMRIGMSSRF